jgi:putative effector of murein hydrolase
VAGAGLLLTLYRVRTLGSLSSVFSRRRDGGTLPDDMPSSMHTLAAVATIWWFDKTVAHVLTRLGSTFPSSIVSMMISLSALTGAQAVLGEAFTDRCVSLLAPGTGFLGKHLLAFLTPVVAPIPTAICGLWAEGGAPTLLRVLVLHFGGWACTHATSGVIARAVGNATEPESLSPPATPPRTPDPEEQAAIETQLSNSAVQEEQKTEMFTPGVRKHEREKAARQHAAAHQTAVRDVWTTAACIGYGVIPLFGPAPALVCTLQATLLHAQRIPTRIGLGPAAPLVISAAATAAACVSLGRLRGDTMTAAFTAYGMRSRIPFWGSAGAVHVELLSAATFALGFRVFALRQLVLTNIKAILATCVIGATSSLLLTPLVARLVGLSPILSLMLSQRSVTTPFALAGAATLGPAISPVLTASVVSIGAIHCAVCGLRILDWLGLVSAQHPVARGLAMGCSSYGVGTGTLLQQGEAEAAGVSSAALVLIGFVHALLLSSRPVLTLMRFLAGAAS